MARILLIDDNPLALADMAGALESLGHQVRLGGLGQRAVRDAASLDYDCLVTDTAIRGASGWYLMRCARRTHPGAAIIATHDPAGHGAGADPNAIAAFNAMNGADATLAKPVATERLRALVSNLLANHGDDRQLASA